jgi:hypothetical protein
MKNQGLINNIISENTCSGNMDEKVIALASGEIENYEERLNILIHVLSCEWCRLLFEDTLLLLEDQGNNDRPHYSPVIELGIKGNRVIPLTAESAEYSAALLAGEEYESAEFTVKHNNEEITLRVLKSDEGVDFDLSIKEENAKFYLISNKGFNTAFQYDGIARFENIKPGRYALTRNLREFIFINIIKN